MQSVWCKLITRGLRLARDKDASWRVFPWTLAFQFFWGVHQLEENGNLSITRHQEWHQTKITRITECINAKSQLSEYLLPSPKQNTKISSLNAFPVKNYDLHTYKKHNKYHSLFIMPPSPRCRAHLSSWGYVDVGDYWLMEKKGVGCRQVVIYPEEVLIESKLLDNLSVAIEYFYHNIQLCTEFSMIPIRTASQICSS